MKAILMSIRPQHTCNILNDIKWWEIRKKFPKDYVGWAYIYVTKDRNKTLSFQVIPHDRTHVKGYNGFNDEGFDFQFITLTKTDINNGWGWFAREHNLNGKVVARFWCDKVEHIEYETCSRDISGWWKDNGEIFSHKDACLTYEEMFDYIGSGEGYAIHITKLEIFDEPKEISEFKVKGFERIKVMGSPYGDLDSVAYHYEKKPKLKPLTRAPQSWCYVEV